MAAPFVARLLKHLRSCERVEAILIVKGQLLTRRALRSLRDTAGCPLICWNPDSPFDPAISNCGGGILEAVGMYDLYITWSSSLRERISLRGQHCVTIPFGADWGVGRELPDERMRWLAGRPVFAGSFTKERLDLLRPLRRQGLVIFGNHWPPGSGIDVRPAVLGSSYTNVIRTAACAINLLRPQNRDSHNMRSFEIPACGGRQLAPWTGDHVRLLPSTHVTLFDDARVDLESAVEVALTAGPPGDVSAEWMSRHSYDSRINTLIGELYRLQQVAL